MDSGVTVFLVMLGIIGPCALLAACCILGRKLEKMDEGSKSRSRKMPVAMPLAPAPLVAPRDNYEDIVLKQNWQKNYPQPPVKNYNMTPNLPNPPSPSMASSPSSEQLPQSAPQTSSSASDSYNSATGQRNIRSNPAFSSSEDNKKRLGFAMNIFSYEELVEATAGFSDPNFIGEGGFGLVYKGVLRNGMEVAVKSLRAGSCQGDKEFEAEVETVSRAHHRHLVSLVGYCITDSNRLLVYEFVPNGTLHFHLHGKDLPTMSWEARIKIAIGSAKGLAYLHEDCHPKIIHRDIKAANILLDFDFQAKVADFGLAKFSLEQNTHVSTRVMGTFGYLAPEYAATGKLTEKSDVFSFGVVLLELISGCRPAVEDESLVEWAKYLFHIALEDGNFEPLVDSKLGSKYDRDEMTRMVSCASACVRHSAKRRPKMSQIVRALEGNMSLSDLNQGVKPGFSAFYNGPPQQQQHASSDYDTRRYKDDLERFRQRRAMLGGSLDSGGSYASGSSSGGGQS